MIKKILYASVMIGALITSCGTQKRITATKEKSKTTRESVNADSVALNDLQAEMSKKLGKRGVDSSLNKKIVSLLSTLQGDLSKIQQTVSAVDFFLEKKKNFRTNNYEDDVKPYVDRLDSFQLQKKTRDRIYQLLDEAVKMEAFQKYGMGAFFEPGIYRIAPAAFSSVNRSFQPAIDSMSAISNRYPDIKRTAHLVIVGYADATPITPGTPLFNELKSYMKQPDPQSVQMNQVLSDLRANELLRNLKIIMRTSASKFSNYNQLKIGYSSYGRGEALPFNNITDYTDNDERRRVVVFYWAILPEL
ncbi:hypothetical protein U0035_10640 [Niabella yanshanensis]|uniref:OmpA family protein n=1 Tax=Niabella yanshanensis TaxID=577386 RepID=A0ABZ0WD01_9BACT|nr:hypothetical protein [Niabella yanshanensis]WQD40605.1 hypothetical protein U0035_10640 [Niabella yanshanensis]